MRLKMIRINNALTLLLPALLALALGAGCGDAAPSDEVQQQNIQGEIEAQNAPPIIENSGPVGE